MWATGAALALTLTLAFALLGVVLYNGLGVFWPRAVYLVTLDDGSKLLGELVERDRSRVLVINDAAKDIAPAPADSDSAPPSAPAPDAPPAPEADAPLPAADALPPPAGGDMPPLPAEDPGLPPPPAAVEDTGVPPVPGGGEANLPPLPSPADAGFPPLPGSAANDVPSPATGEQGLPPLPGGGDEALPPLPTAVDDSLPPPAGSTEIPPPPAVPAPPAAAASASQSGASASVAAPPRADSSGDKAASAIATAPQVPEGTAPSHQSAATGDESEHEYKYVERIKYKTGNMEDGPSFRWVDTAAIREIEEPADAIVLERTENMNYYGFCERLITPSLNLGAKGEHPAMLSAALAAVRKHHDEQVAPIDARQQSLAQQYHNEVKYALLRARYDYRQLMAAGRKASDPELESAARRVRELESREQQLLSESERLKAESSKLEKNLRENVGVFHDSDGREKHIALLDIVRFYQPNDMGLGGKMGHYAAKVWELLTADPRESNQEGGLFPAIFGTVLMVFLMSILCFPLGVLAGIYLGEYAKEGPLVRLVRIAVNNLAGIPSIVYGIFGLGFFIYIVGSNLDQWLYPERVAASEPVFGQGCIIWASLTLGLLTIPVVIVSVEEALRAIPRGVSEGSYALGATKFQTLSRVLLPMASPGMMTGFILAMARAAGEVAPLMLTGAAKSAAVPFDSSPPFIHLDRQFMHLGFHILDISCKSPNVEATKPMVYVTTLLLLAIVLTMSSVAIFVRHRMRKRYQSRSI
ncbi:MAG: phosphate ABC transporter permease PstA [Planctomycetota bacterium]